MEIISLENVSKQSNRKIANLETLNSVVIRLNKLNKLISPFIDRETEHLNEEYEKKRRRLSKGKERLISLKKRCDNFKEELDLCKHRNDLLLVINSILETVNLGKSTLKNIRAIFDGIDSFSKSELLEKKKVFEDIYNKYCRNRD